jgi:hypothetical protein
MADKTPKGVIAIFTDDEGRVIATAADFNPDRPGGFKMIEAQRTRATRQLAWKVVDAYASPGLTRAISEYEREQIVRTLQTQHKCKVTVSAIGYSDDEAALL